MKIVGEIFGVTAHVVERNDPMQVLQCNKVTICLLSSTTLPSKVSEPDVFLAWQLTLPT